MADAVEQKPRKESPESHPSVAPRQKHVPRETAEDFRKKSSSSVGKTPPRANKERPTRRTSSTATHSVRGIPKSDVCMFLFTDIQVLKFFLGHVTFF